MGIIMDSFDQPTPPTTVFRLNRARLSDPGGNPKLQAVPIVDPFLERRRQQLAPKPL